MFEFRYGYDDIAIDYLLDYDSRILLRKQQ